MTSEAPEVSKKIDVFMLLLCEQFRRIQLFKRSKTIVFEGMNTIPC